MKFKLMTILAAVFLLLTACGTSSEKEKNGSEEVSKSTCEQMPEQSSEEQSEASKVYPQLTTNVQGNERLVGMDTTMGCIKIKLFPDQAPKTVENFIKHSEDGYYDGLIFHRVIKDFMIQGGDPQGTGMGGESIYGQAFEDEFSDKLFNIRGALSMANSGPNTNGSQFFIVQKNALDEGMADQMKQAGYPDDVIKAYENGGTPWLDFKHTVFGQVIEGMDIVDKIANAKTIENDKPEDDIKIKKIYVIK
ncbi:peptidylprolyl isomerase [Bacillus sp. CGMCC 1.16607]|uniref:peptidylprolyl isomerase n=1 Tax=Bacillus sp. CGMCC 1.16607 TaxID=3351842 RepID=UPI00364218BD